VLIGERDFLDCTSGRLDGCEVRVGVISLSGEVESSEDGILMGSFGVMYLCPAHIFLFFGKEEGMIVDQASISSGQHVFLSLLCFLRIIIGLSSSVSPKSLRF